MSKAGAKIIGALHESIGHAQASAEARATFEVIRAEIREAAMAAETAAASHKDRDLTDSKVASLRSIATGLSRALAILDRHMKEKGSG